MAAVKPPVEEAQIKALAERIGAYDYVTYSSFTMENVPELLDTLIEAGMAAKHGQSVAKQKRGCVLQ
jgi:hypothetical protein